ncbi:TPA: chlorohydrolase [Streptococcus pneumoniae]
MWIELTKSALKHCFEVVDRTDEVSNHTHDKPTLTWFEEIFEEYHSPFHN